MEVLGFSVVGKTFEECVKELLERYIQLNMESQIEDIKVFKQELKRVLKPSN